MSARSLPLASHNDIRTQTHVPVLRDHSVGGNRRWKGSGASLALFRVTSPASLGVAFLAPKCCAAVAHVLNLAALHREACVLMALAALHAGVLPDARVRGLVTLVVRRRPASKVAPIPQTAPRIRLDAVLRLRVLPDRRRAGQMRKLAPVLRAEEALGRLTLGVLCLVLSDVEEVQSPGRLSCR